MFGSLDWHWNPITMAFKKTTVKMKLENALARTNLLKPDD
jgi:hypothetical protein